MTQYITLNVKLSNLQLNNLKSAIRNGTELTLNFSSNVNSDSMMRLIFHITFHILTDRQVLGVCKALANNSSADTTLSIIQLSKMVRE